MSDPKPQAPADPVLLGVVGGAHGIKGEVRIRSFTADPTDIGAYGPLVDAKGNRYTIRSARVQKTVVVAAIAEVRDRNHAERLNGTELFVDRSMLPDEDDEDAFFQTDLVGLSAVSVTGEPIGTVIAIHDFGAGDVVEIRPERGATVMIPFSEAAVPEIDIEAGSMTVEPVAAGLAETVGDQAEEAAGLAEPGAGEPEGR
ncbi:MULTISPECIES: ribosome maturation factor RimM [unclassified Aureimonas]|uniref:ribosome maturation factor RimM n=1 Tax=unclassified Aureimonas TaxID=2615206 RepID=UPI0006FC0855|nr:MULTISPECIES: ribosome maturation factor RimM [unclassified Aureimonas]KQT65932.1 ribosome maturation factor RimM [Aureimonas sp. Leaf427]KQT73291.1 ribosome maturation factor RimM [Aureimonas sp. Leaf460]